MALRGNLKDFSLPDVFQLVQLSGKTGVLRIVRADTEGSIWFRDGDVFFARSNWRHDLLGERLVSAQRITPPALKRALEIHTAEGGTRRLGEILVSEGYITQQVLETFVQEQIEDTIFDIMRWDDGDFDFETLPEVVHEDIGLSVSVENIVMEGSRRLEEWNRIKKKVPSADMVFKMATAPGEGTFEISLKPIEWNLLLLIDGTRSVRDLALEVHSTDFEVARVIYGLFSAGLLEVPSDEEVERLRSERAAREAKREQARSERLVTEPDAGQAPPEEALEPAHETGDAAPEPAPELQAEPADVVESATEMPEFLSVGADAPSDDDMAVFTSMMEAVLQPHEIESEPTLPAAGPTEVPAYEDASVPYVPDALEQWTDSMLPSEDIEPEVIEADAGAAPVAEDIPADDLTGYPELGALSVEEIGEIPAPPIAEIAPLPEGFTATGDFETDLRTLGLGEYPSELLEPEPLPDAQEPMPALDTESYFFEAEPAEEEAPGVAQEVTPEAPAVDLESGDDWARFVESVETPASEMYAGTSGEVAAEGGDELDSLLESLGSPDESSAGIISSGTDFGSEDEPGEYISTDSFLAEFDTDSGLSGGLGDELTALTGGGSARARPVATVSSIPEPGEGGKLHIDQAVDRELLEKIIKGVEDL